MHYFYALLFWLLYECLSLPLRFALGAVAMPSDVRRVLSRIAGPAMLVMLAWFGGHLGLKIGFASTGLIVGAGFATGIGIWAVRKRAPRSFATVRSSFTPRTISNRKIALEAIGPIIFFGYLAFRMRAPEMTFEIGNSGAEKFPNAMFFWSAWHARTLPPDDYWLSGNPQLYYYWGHFFWAWIGRAGGFPAEWVITLGLARLVQLVWEASYLLLRGFGLRIVSSICGALVIALGGNPQAVVTLHKQYKASVELAETTGRPTDFASIASDWEFGGYSFWEPSRVIENTVNEFPIWSAILGDFHAHHLALPWMIAWIGLLAAGDRWFGLSRNFKSGFPWLAAALCLAVYCVLGMSAALSNLWNLPLVAIGGFFTISWKFRGPAGGWIGKLFYPLLLVAMLLVAVLLSREGNSIPLSKTSVYTVPPDFFGFLPNGFTFSFPVDFLRAEIRSTPSELLLLWGFQVILIVAGAIGCTLVRPNAIKVGLTLTAIGLIGAAYWIYAGDPPPVSQPAVYWGAMVLFVAALGWGKRSWLSMRAALLVAGACVLLGGLELFYVQDRMTGALARYNSYFKLSYPAWPVLGAGAWVCLHRLWHLRMATPLRIGLRAALLVPILLSSVMVLFGVPARTVQATWGDRANWDREPTLDAFAWIEGRAGYEAEAEVLAWIRNEVPPGERALSLPLRGGYNYGGRVASLGGHPALLGWEHHEFQWRGENAAGPVAAANRTAFRFYRARDPESMRRASRELECSWVMLGKNELERLGTIGFETALENLRRAGVEVASSQSGPNRTFLFRIEASGDSPDSD